jgi:hypothetical protein
MSPSSTPQSPVAPKGKSGAKRGRKRKATGDDNFEIANYMDGQVNKGGRYLHIFILVFLQSVHCSLYGSA